MKILSAFLISLFLFVAPIHAEGNGSPSDLDLQITLENQFTTKLHQVMPDKKFVITVTFHQHESVQLDILGDSVDVVDKNKAVLQQIQDVKVLSEDSIDSSTISKIIGVPTDKIKMIQLELPKKAAPVVDDSMIAKTQDYSKDHYQSLVTFGFAILGILGLILIFSIFNIGTGLKNLMSSVTQGFQNFAQASTQQNELANEKVAAPEKAPDPYLPKDHAFTPLQLKAMFAECYWTGYDAEASALVRHYPNIEAYQELRFGTTYLDYLKRVKPGSLDFASDPYFLSPNAAFFDMSLDDTPAQAIPAASQLRFEKANTGAIELIQIQQNPDVTPLIRSAHSTLRTLKQPIRVRFKSTDEEQQVLESNAIPKDIKAQLPSLYVLKQLSAESFVNVVSQLTVKELAQAWLGPEWLLQDLESKLPDRKRDLLKDVMLRVKPSRQSAAFQKIMDLCQHELKTNPIHAPVSGKAAA